MNFPHKGYGRIYVETPDQVPLVSAIIKELDEFEHRYMPPNFIAPFSEYPRVEYTHKFSDLDTDRLIVICWQRGIKIFCFSSGLNEYPADLREKTE